jgi:hypothetical protein
MAADASIKLTLEGSGLSYSGSVTLAQAAEIVRVASLSPEQLSSGLAPLPSMTVASQASGIEKLSLPEALNRSKPTTSAETIAVIATWIMDSEGVESVSRADVASRYRDARLPPPGNLPRDFSQAVRKGFLASVRGNSDQFYVTQTGRALLTPKEKN